MLKQIRGLRLDMMDEKSFEHRSEHFYPPLFSFIKKVGRPFSLDYTLVRILICAEK